MRRFITFGPALVVLVTAIVTLIAAPAAVRAIGYANTQATIQLAQQSLDQDNILKAIDRATRAIADTVEPSVVHISVRERGSRGGWARMGTGSGWVYDDRGHIVTNSHVVKGSTSVMVQFQDGRAVSAKIVGQDPSTDIAVLKVESVDGLFPIKRAPDVALHQGDRVYAFGSPFGFKFSMSEGIVSGLGRDPNQIVGSDGGFTNFIQTDAAVNPGNSGGPLVNVEGRLVGMNVAIATAPGLNSNGEGQNSGISFAIPVATIESVVEQIISTGVIARGFLGVDRPMNDDENARMLAITDYRGRGVFIRNVSEDGPAAKAGIRAGDIIVNINGQPASTVAAFRSLIANNAPGDKVKVDVYRSGKTESFDVTLGTLPPTLPELREAMRLVETYGIVALAQGDDGLEIVRMSSPSEALRAGLRPEHRITAVAGTIVSRVEDFATELVRKGLLQGRAVPITVTTGLGQEREFTITP